MTTREDRLGSSGMFQRIAMSARKLKRALSESDEDLPAEAQELGEKIAQAFVANRFADVHAMATASLQQRTSSEQFEASWRGVADSRGPLTGFEVSDAGQIDLGFIPGLEDLEQSQFVAFIEIVFSSPAVALDDEKALTIGVVMIDEGGATRIGAIHTR